MPRRQQVNQVALQLVRVLVFIHQDELEAPLVLLADLLMLLHQLEPERQQVVEVHRVRRPLARGITLLDVRNLRRQMLEVVVLLLQHLRNRLVRVDRQRKDVPQHLGLREPRRLHIHFRLRHAGGDQVLGVLAVHDGKVPLVAEQVRRAGAGCGCRWNETSRPTATPVPAPANPPPAASFPWPPCS